MQNLVYWVSTLPSILGGEEIPKERAKDLQKSSLKQMKQMIMKFNGK